MKNNKINKKTVLSMLVAGVIFSSSAAQAAYNVPANLGFNDDATTALTGPLHGTKPWLPKVVVEEAGVQVIKEGESIRIRFDNPLLYQFADTDKDLDISPENFKWYTFKNPVELIEELKNKDTARTIEKLVEDGIAAPIDIGNVTNQEKISTLIVPALEEGVSVGFVITPTTSNGYPDTSKFNTTLIVPSVTYQANIDENGNPGYVDQNEIKGIIMVDYAVGSVPKNFVPPRDVRGEDNINDDVAKIDEWKKIKFVMKVVNPLQRNIPIDLSTYNTNGNNGIVTIANYDDNGVEREGITLNTSASFNDMSNSMFKDILLEYGLMLIGDGFTYDPIAQTLSFEVASNKPFNGSVRLDFEDIEAPFIADNGSDTKPFSFVDQPSESITMKMFDRGINGDGARVEVTPEDAIAPNHRYEVAVIDTANLTDASEPTDVTHYFANHIKWAYTTVDLSPQFVKLDRCAGTVMFPTQTNNENAESEVKNLAPDLWPNFEQGLSLKPYIELPSDIVDGTRDFAPITGESMLVCDPGKVNGAHVPFSWFN